MTTPAPPSLAALYAERAQMAYYLEHPCLPWHSQQRGVLLNEYETLQAEITTLEAQWPTRWVRTVPLPTGPAPPEMQAILDDVAQIAARDAARRERLGIVPWREEERS